jgi:hypothetical protein
MEIVIKGNKIPLRFSYALIRALAKKWGITNVEAVLNKIMVAFSKAEDDVFSAIDTVVEIVVEAAKLTGNEVDPDDVGDELFGNMVLMMDVINEFVGSIPQVKPEDVEILKKKLPKPQK